MQLLCTEQTQDRYLLDVEKETEGLSIYFVMYIGKAPLEGRRTSCQRSLTRLFGNERAVLIRTTYCTKVL